MRKAGITFPLFLLAAAATSVSACDHESEPTAPSTFPGEAALSLSVAGIVVAGDAIVPSAVIALAEPPSQQVTDVGGRFVFPYAPFLYDLAVRSAPDREVVAFRELAFTYVTLPISHEKQPAGFSETLNPVLEPPLEPGETVTWFLNGPDAAWITPQSDGSLAIGTTRFSGSVTLVAIRHPIDGGVPKATALGKADLSVSSGQVLPVRLELEKLGDPLDLTVTVHSPDGYVTADLALDFGRRGGQQIVGKMPLGAKTPLAALPGGWVLYVHVNYTDGAKGESGRLTVDPFFKPVFDVQLPIPPVPDDTTPGALSALATGVREHVLVPDDATADTIRVFSTSYENALPDTTKVGGAPISGSYTWTVTHWPSTSFVEALTGARPREQYVSATSAPRKVLLP